MAWPYTFAAMTAPQLSYLDSNFAQAAQLGTDVTFSGIDNTPIGATTPAAANVTTLTTTGAATFGATATVSAGAAGASGFLVSFAQSSTAYGSAHFNSNDTNGNSQNYSILCNRAGDLAGFAAWEVNGAVVGSITTNGSSTAYNTTSDAALKTVFGPADGSIMSALPVRLCTFTGSPGQTPAPMVLAQECAAVAPWAIRDGPPGPAMIDYSKLVAGTLAYAQSLEGRIASLESALALALAALKATPGMPPAPTAPPPSAALIACQSAVAAAAALPVVQAALARGAAATAAADAAAKAQSSGKTDIAPTP